MSRATGGARPWNESEGRVGQRHLPRPPTSALIDAPRQSNFRLRASFFAAIITTAATPNSHPDCRATRHRERAWPFGFEHLPYCLFTQFRMPVRLGVGDALVQQPCVQLVEGFEPQPWREEARPLTGSVGFWFAAMSLPVTAWCQVATHIVGPLNCHSFVTEPSQSLPSVSSDGGRSCSPFRHEP
jgi:hypothetical protein